MQSWPRSTTAVSQVIPISRRSESPFPITPKVSQKTRAIIPAKHGMAVYLPVSIFIHLLTAQMLLAFMRLNHGLSADFFSIKSKRIWAIAADRSKLHAPSPSALQYAPGFLFFILIQPKLFQDQFIPFRKLTGCKTHRNIRLLCMIFNEMHNSMKTSVNGSAVIVCITEIQPLWFFPIFCHMDRMGYQFIDSLIFSLLK